MSQTQQAALPQRLAKAQAEMAQVNPSEHTRSKRFLPQVSEVREAAEAMVHRSRVGGLLEALYHERIVSERPVRRSHDRAADTRVEREVSPPRSGLWSRRWWLPARKSWSNAASDA